ncbi:carboxyvinyl-carboxyphosphonate phosphorylmutase [Candidatus Entotheonella serta]|nr:carboxyvinyl-carboxyphosphonate phosphorylmutase [Candidatus Entotheonella serta]
MATAPMKMTTRLRQLMAAPGLIRAVNVYDPLTARIAESSGFQAIALGGFQLGAHLCTTEPLLTMTEVMNCSRYITASVNIPLKVDCGTGFGDPTHVTRTVREAEAAGIACIHIEDQVFPKRAHYHKGIEHIVTVEEMVDKIKAAVNARTDPDFVIVGRTDAMKTDDVHEGIRRGNLYAEAGCDMVEVFPNTLEAARLVAKEVQAPTLYVNSPGNRLSRPLIPWTELEEMGYKMALDSTTVAIAAAHAVQETLQQYLSQQGPPLSQDMAIEAREWIETIIGLPEYYRIEEETTER